jgi:hypothetical protein
MFLSQLVNLTVPDATTQLDCWRASRCRESFPTSIRDERPHDFLIHRSQFLVVQFCVSLAVYPRTA